MIGSVTIHAVHYLINGSKQGIQNEEKLKIVLEGMSVKISDCRNLELDLVF